jgi:hypothetical protein
VLRIRLLEDRAQEDDVGCLELLKNPENPQRAVSQDWSRRASPRRRASPDAFRHSDCHGLSVIGRPGPEIRCPNYLKVEAVPRSTSGIEAAIRPVTRIEWRFTKWKKSGKKQEGGSQWFGGGRRNGSR